MHRGLLYALTGEHSCSVCTYIELGNGNMPQDTRVRLLVWGSNPRSPTEVDLLACLLWSASICCHSDPKLVRSGPPIDAIVSNEPQRSPCQVAVRKSWSRVTSMESCLPRFPCTHRWKKLLRLRRLRPHRLPRYRRRPLGTTSSTPRPRLEGPSRPIPVSIRRADASLVRGAAPASRVCLWDRLLVDTRTAASLPIFTTRSGHRRLSIASQIDALLRSLVRALHFEQKQICWCLNGFSTGPF